MTNEQIKAKELAELLNAFSEGKQLQIHKKGNLLWEDCELNINDVATITALIHQVGNPIYHIRIKPETKQIPLTQQDLIDRIKEGKTMWVKHGYGYCAITDFNDTNAFISDDEFTYEQLSKLEWLDGTPCYKEVECE